MDGDGMSTAERISFWSLYKHSVFVIDEMDVPPDQGRGGTFTNS